MQIVGIEYKSGIVLSLYKIIYFDRKECATDVERTPSKLDLESAS